MTDNDSSDSSVPEELINLPVLQSSKRFVCDTRSEPLPRGCILVRRFEYLRLFYVTGNAKTLWELQALWELLAMCELFAFRFNNVSISMNLALRQIDLRQTTSD